MRTILATSGGKANAGAATLCGRSRNTLRSNYLVMQKVRGSFRIKTARQLLERTGHPLRTCEYWLSKNRLPWEAVAALIADDRPDAIGYEIVDAIANETSWWRRIRRALGVLDGQENELRELINEYRSLVAEARAETALGVRSSGVAGAKVGASKVAAAGRDRGAAQTKGRR